MRQPETTEPLASLRTAAQELKSIGGPLDVAAHCVESMLAVTPCGAGLVLFHDFERNDLVVVHALGAGAHRFVRSRWAGDSDQGDSCPPARHLPLGTPASVCTAPVMSWGRCIAAFELVARAHPSARAVFDARTLLGIRHVADRFAAYLAQRGVSVGFRILDG